MKLKKSVKVQGMTTEIALALMIIDGVYNMYGQELVVTSIMDGRHSRTSSHYAGNGIDTRTRYFTDQEKLAVAQDCRDRLGRDFDVIVETDHLHFQYKPKRR